MFINCRIRGEAEETMGVVGVGFQVDSLQRLLGGYEEEFGVHAYLVGEDGTLEVSTGGTGYQAVNLFDMCAFPELREEILRGGEEGQTSWYASGYVVSQYIPSLGWHLVVEKDTSDLDRQLNLQFVRGVVIILLIIAAVLVIITRVLRRYNARLIQLTMAGEQERRTRFQKVTEQLYENIYELDITHNRAGSEATEQYFESLGVPRSTPYDRALQLIADRQIKPEYRRGYVDTFTPEHVLRVFAAGTESLSYDFQITSDGARYHWMRITARIYRLEEDGSVRMLVYRQNIEAEKQRERLLFDQTQRDALTGLYNKAATQERIRARLAERPGGRFAFFMLDVDHFKRVNDELGHAVGDAVLAEFSRDLRVQFREDDIVGRIGGDEFVAFLPLPGRAAAEQKARELVEALAREVGKNGKTCRISASVGVALAPEAGERFEALYRNADQALYQTKERGRDGYTVFTPKQ